MRDRGAARDDDEREETYLAGTTIANEDELEGRSLSHYCDALMCCLERGSTSDCCKPLTSNVVWLEVGGGLVGRC